jgi:hypothetical protein
LSDNQTLLPVLDQKLNFAPPIKVSIGFMNIFEFTQLFNLYNGRVGDPVLSAVFAATESLETPLVTFCLTASSITQPLALSMAFSQTKEKRWLVALCRSTQRLRVNSSPSSDQLSM